MKYLILITLLASCAVHVPDVQRRGYEKDKKKVNHVDQLRECVVDLVGRFGVKATEAEEVCSRIYRRN